MWVSKAITFAALTLSASTAWCADRYLFFDTQTVESYSPQQSQYDMRSQTYRLDTQTGLLQSCTSQFVWDVKKLTVISSNASCTNLQYGTPPAAGNQGFVTSADFYTPSQGALISSCTQANGHGFCPTSSLLYWLVNEQSGQVTVCSQHAGYPAPPVACLAAKLN
jgi:hypothetical protein